MTLHRELLAQARHLAEKEPRRPRQASLRRAVSTAYYALFHYLIDEATKLFLGGSARANLRHCLARTFSHSTMAKASKTVSSHLRGQNSPKFAALLTDTPPCELERVAKSFVDLQQLRQEADYDMSQVFTRREVLDHVETAEGAIKQWHRIRRSSAADAYLLALMAWDRIKAPRQ